ncbi:unnamed protein product, partial [Closterium sp. NIES-53]
LPPPSDVTEEQLDARFLEIGPITNAVVMLFESGVSKGFGFVNFQDPGSAQKAVEKLNNAQFGASSLFAWSGPGFAGAERVLRRLTTCNDGGVSKGFGFVNFLDPASAQEAVEKLNNAQFGSKAILVARAQKKSEREQMLRSQYEEKKMERLQRFQITNLYVKNLEEAVGEAEGGVCQVWSDHTS